MNPDVVGLRTMALRRMELELLALELVPAVDLAMVDSTGPDLVPGAEA